ncbi:MAG: hypothetical protein JWN34_4895 [Bryobacterales bacterium]|jgi:hypothetical protein|nr:hypothetical protein [Bryobacterales bacterium]
MHRRYATFAALFCLVALGTALAWQKPFRQYAGLEYEDFPLPPDYQEKTEWVFARLMYPANETYGFRGSDDWKQGASNWTIDYPRSDRHLTMAVRRLTRLHVRSVEQVVDLDDVDDVFNYPWLYAVELGYWNLSPSQIVKFREYLLRGGFFMCDDFHGTQEWAGFMRILSQVFPDRKVVDIPEEDPIFHVLYDLKDRYQVPGAQFLYSGRKAEKDGTQAHWRGVYDDNGRLMMAICHNMDLGDSWEWADVPQYPEAFSSLGIKIATNYIIYSMTH